MQVYITSSHTPKRRTLFREMCARMFFALCFLIIGSEFCSCDEDFQRTIVFIFAPTYPGENVFLRGGRCTPCLRYGARSRCALRRSSRSRLLASTVVPFEQSPFNVFQTSAAKFIASEVRYHETIGADVTMSRSRPLNKCLTCEI